MELQEKITRKGAVYRFKLIFSGTCASMGSLRFTAILQPAEEAGFVIKCVELPVATEGETREEAIANLKEAIQGYLEVKAERLREQREGERVEVIVEAPSDLIA